MRLSEPLILTRQIWDYLSLVRTVYDDNKYSQTRWFYIDNYRSKFKSDFEECALVVHVRI